VTPAVRENPVKTLAKPWSDARALGPWYTVEFVNSFACTLLLVCVPYFITDRFHSAQPTMDSLWQSALWGLMYVPFAILAGKLADRWGARRLLARACILALPAAVVGLLAAAWPNFWVLFAVLLFYNLANTHGWPAMESAISQTPARAGLPARMGFYNIVWSAAGFLAFPAADLVKGLSSFDNWASMWLLPAAGAVVALIAAVWFAIPQSALQRADGHDAENGDDGPPGKAKTLLRMAWVGNPMAYVAINVLMAVMPQISPKIVSLGSVWKLTTVVGFVIWWKWSGWHYKTWMLIAAYAGLIGSFFAMLFFAAPGSGTPIGLLVPAQIVFGLATSLIYSSSLYYAMHVSAGGGSHAGMHEALIGGGICIGCAVGALAVGIGSSTLAPVAWAVTAILAAGGVTIVIVAIRGSMQKLR
jgi:MFS family permease